MKTVTSVTIWTDAVGKRISVTYSVIDEATGRIVSDNKRLDRVITDQAAIDQCTSLMAIAQQFVDRQEG